MMGRLSPLLLLGFALLSRSSGAMAAPLLESRVGGLGLVGAAIDHPASVYYNPATLSLQTGHHVFLDGMVRLGAGQVSLAATEPSTGAPRADRQPAQDLRDLFPQLFLTASSDLGFDSVVLSLTLHTPYASRYSFLRGAGDGELFDPAAQGPSRYHVVDFTFWTLSVTPAASFRIFDKLSIGVAFSYIYVASDFAFVRDAALAGGARRASGEYAALDDCGGTSCGYGGDAAAEAIRLRGHANALQATAGVLVRPHPAVDLGVGYRSRMIGWGESNVPVRGDVWVRRSQATLANAARDTTLTGPVARDLTGRGSLTMSLPDEVHVGAVWRTTPRLLLDLEFRWFNFAALNSVDLRLSGSELRARPETPDRLVLYRGFQDVFAVQLGASYQLTPRFTLQGASMLETSAVPAEAVSPASVDALKVDSFLAFRWSLGRNFTLRGGYGLTLMPPRDVTSSVFSPSDMVACVDKRYDVDLAECQRSSAGRGVASAAGHYSLMVHRFDLSLGWDLW